MNIFIAVHKKMRFKVGNLSGKNMHFLILDSVKVSFYKRETYGSKPVPYVHCLLLKTWVIDTELESPQHLFFIDME